MTLIVMLVLYSLVEIHNNRQYKISYFGDNMVPLVLILLLTGLDFFDFFLPHLEFKTYISKGPLPDSMCDWNCVSPFLRLRVRASPETNVNGVFVLNCLIYLFIYFKVGTLVSFL